MDMVAFQTPFGRTHIPANSPAALRLRGSLSAISGTRREYPGGKASEPDLVLPSSGLPESHVGGGGVPPSTLAAPGFNSLSPTDLAATVRIPSAAVPNNLGPFPSGPIAARAQAPSIAPNVLGGGGGMDDPRARLMAILRALA